eukprot:Tamp_21855.p1 GENE.Tamp_21855~~Tamp_21855.p1  ORF type:complete len:314 (+),score=75.41 Tamp_21855:104-943(+)
MVDRQELKNLLKDLVSDDAYWQRQRGTYDTIFDEVDTLLRREERPLKEILNPGVMAKLLDQVESAEVDPSTLKAFMRTPAVESMAGAILYTGIFEFVQAADILGNIVNQLPVIGPIRQEINKSLKQQLDSTLGPQVTKFLGTQSRPAVEQMIAFITDDGNKQAFGKSGRRLAEYLLSRPVTQLMPSRETALKIRDEGWPVIRELVSTVEAQEKLIDGFFEKNGDTNIGEYLPDLPPSAKRGFLRIWQRFLDSEEGMGLGLSDAPVSGSNMGRDREREFE